MSGENEGLTPYVPWIVFTSAGLMGDARARRRSEEDGREGLMEWACTLRFRRQLWLCASIKGDDGSAGTDLKTSFGSPNLLKTKDLACV